MWHVDTVQALSESHREILRAVLQSRVLPYLADCLVVLKSPGVSIADEDALIGRLKVSQERPAYDRAVFSETQESNSEDKNYLASLLIRCYPDIPRSSAAALVASDVMAASPLLLIFLVILPKNQHP